MDHSFFAAGQVNTVSLDLDGNCERVLEVCRRARERGIKLVAFPELVLTGYDCGDFFNVPAFMSESARAVLSLKYSLPEGVTAGVGAVLPGSDGRAYDAYVILKRGKILGISAVSSFNDSRDQRVRNLTTAAYGERFILGAETFVSSNIVEVDGVKVGVYFTPADIPSLQGVDLAISPAVERFELFGRNRREVAAAALSLVLNTVVLTTSLLGCEGGSNIYDGLSLVAEKGSLLASSKSLSFARERLFTCDEGLNAELPEYDCIVRAVALGLFDWMRKTKAHGFALSLSGGADSGLCATVVCYALTAALKEQGFETFRAELEALNFKCPDFTGDVASYIKKEIMPQALITVYQGSDVSGDVTRTAARELSAGIGARHYEWSVSKLIADYTSVVNTTTPEDPLNWERDDLTLQNIQARSRAPGIWMIANRYNKLLLTTCNASEDAVGYCTMDGDTAGGLAPIGDISKSRILKINSYIAKEGLIIDDELRMQLPQMSYIACQAPTAELKPGQTDERDLMPYTILDRIHELQQGSLLAPKRILDTLESEFGNFSRHELKEFVIRYYRRLSQAQWKRERSALTFHIEKNDLNAKSGFVFPVLSDGFRGLLKDLT